MLVIDLVPAKTIKYWLEKYKANELVFMDSLKNYYTLNCYSQEKLTDYIKLCLTGTFSISFVYCTLQLLLGKIDEKGNDVYIPLSGVAKVYNLIRFLSDECEITLGGKNVYFKDLELHEKNELYNIEVKAKFIKEAKPAELFELMMLYEKLN